MPPVAMRGGALIGAVTLIVLIGATEPVSAVTPRKKGGEIATELCAARNCANGGVCALKNGIAVCYCPDGWIGITCNVKDVQPKSKNLNAAGTDSSSPLTHLRLISSHH